MNEKTDDLKGRAKEAAGDLTDDGISSERARSTAPGPGSRRFLRRPGPRSMTPSTS